MTGRVLALSWAYARASSKAQNLATQKDAIAKAAAARGDEVWKWLEEKKSGKNIARPVLDELRAAVRAGNVKRLYVYRLDRLTRSGIRDTFELISELRAHGVELVSASESWLDLSGPMTDVIIAVMAWAAQMERLAINERIASARERVEGEGGSWGRPRRTTEDDERRVRLLRSVGKSVRDIAIALKIPRATVGRVVRRLKK